MEKGEKMIQIDMPMPESCYDCPLTYVRPSNLVCVVLDKNIGECYQYPTHRETWMEDGLDERRLPDCPLREVEEWAK